MSTHSLTHSLITRVDVYTVISDGGGGDGTNAITLCVLRLITI